MEVANSFPHQFARFGLLLAGLAFLATAAVDVAEHFRLEREASGRWFGWASMSPGETLVHATLALVLVALMVLARPLPEDFGTRDVFVLASPGVILLLGWTDEWVFHRRRVEHREHLMHTTSHLALGSFLTFLFLARVVPWSA